MRPHFQRLPSIDGVSRALGAKRQVSQHSPDDIFDVAAGDYPAGPR
jgi:hypothetical protein